MALGSVDIAVRPDLSKFARELRSGLKPILAAVGPQIRLSVDQRRLAADIAAAVNTAEVTAPALDVPLDVDPAALTANVASAVSGAQGAAPAVDVDMDIDASELVVDASAAVLATERGLPKINVGFRPDLSSLGPTVAGAVTAARGPAASAAAGVGSLIGGTIKASTVAALSGFAGLITAGFASATLGGKLSGDLEQTTIAFEGLLGGAEAAQAKLAELRDFAASTPFEFPELAAATQKLVGAGFAAEDVIPILKSIGDRAAAAGVGAEGIQAVVRALGQIKGRGKVAQEELLQISEAIPGLNGTKAIAEALGTTVEDATEKITKGLVPAEFGIEALIDAMDAFPGSAGAMERQSQTLLGVLSTLKDVARDAFTAAFDTSGARDQLKTLVGSLSAQIGPLTASVAGFASAFLGSAIPAIDAFVAGLSGLDLSPVGKAAGDVFAGVAPLLSGLIELGADLAVVFSGPVGDALDALGSVFADVGGVVRSVAPQLAGLVSSLAGLVSSGLGAFLAAVEPALQAVLPALSTVADALAGVFSDPATQQALAALGTAVGALAAQAVTLIPPLAELAVQVLPGLSTLIEGLAPVFGEFSRILADPAVQEAVRELAVSVADLLVAVAPLIPPLLELAVAVLPLLTGALTAVTDVVQTILEYSVPGLRLLAGVVGEVITALMSGDFAGAFDAISDAVTGWVDSVVFIVEGLGRDIIRGLWDGIVDMKDWLVNRIKGFFNSGVLGTVADVLGIASPSKVMAGLGVNVVQGFVGGIRGELSSVDSVMRSMAGAVAGQSFTTGTVSGTGAAGGLTAAGSSTGAAGGLVVNIASIETSDPEQIVAKLPMAVRRTAAVASRGI